MKLHRDYELTIQLVPYSPNTIVIAPPFTLDFNVSRNTLASANTGTFTIKNLKEDTRRSIYQDIFDTTFFRHIILKAGYKDRMAIIFQGNLRHAYSVRQGTEWNTVMEVFDGGDAIINGFSYFTLPAQTSIKDLLFRVTDDMPNLLGTTIGTFNGEHSRGISVSENSWNFIQNYISPDSHAFIDLEKAYILKLNEYVSGDLLKINSDSGLLDTPQRFNTYLQVKIIFEPSIIVGQLIEIESLERIVNGTYKVIGISHNGNISEAVGGICTTTLSLYVGAELLEVRNFRGVPYKY